MTALRQEFRPRPYQRPFMRYLEGGGKRAMWVVHRRGGKDLTAMHQTVRMMAKRRGAYWHVFPTGEQAKKAIWEGFTKDGLRIMENVFPSAIRKSPRAFLPSSEMVVELHNGSLWRLMGSDRMEVVGAGPVGVTFSEFALSKPNTWDLIRPMLRENEGWAAFITTPRGNNHAKKLYDMAKADPSWFCQLLTLHDTRAYDPERTIAEERASGMPEPLIRQEYLCDWTAALVGSVWGDLLEQAEKEGRIGAFEHERDGVFVNFDLGLNDSTSMWAWRVGDGGVDFVAHYRAHGRPMSHYFDKLDEWAKTLGFKYARFIVPHDARQRSLQTGVGIIDQFEDQCRAERWGKARVDVGPDMSPPDGIQAGRWLLQQNTRFHERCAEGVEALKHYHYGYDEERKDFSKKPVHDWSSHDADGYRYTAGVVRVLKLIHTKPPPKVPKSITAAPLTLDQLWEEHEASQQDWRR